MSRTQLNLEMRDCIVRWRRWKTLGKDHEEYAVGIWTDLV